MTPLRDVTVAARVPLGLRTDLEALLAERQAAGDRRADGGELDLSTLIRRACASYIDLNLNAGRPGSLELGALDGRPRAHRGGTRTEQEAAEGAWPKAETWRRRALELVEFASEDGKTGDELDRDLAAMGAGVYSGRRRLSELKAAGWVEVKRVPVRRIGEDDRVAIERTPARRKTRAGHWAEVYVLTPAARIRLREEAKKL